MQLREGIEAITELPIMPQTVQQILGACAPTHSSRSTTFCKSSNRAPSLAAQVVYWARSPLHGYHGTVDSLKTAIERILGPDNTLNTSWLLHGQNLPPAG